MRNSVSGGLRLYDRLVGLVTCYFRPTAGLQVLMYKMSVLAFVVLDARLASTGGVFNVMCSKLLGYIG